MVCAISRTTVTCCTLGIPLLEFVEVTTIPLPHIHMHTTQLFESNNLPERPILVLSTDGAQDEAPRYPKPLATAICFFKHLKVDVILHSVNAAGLSHLQPSRKKNESIIS